MRGVLSKNHAQLTSSSMIRNTRCRISQERITEIGSTLVPLGNRPAYILVPCTERSAVCKV